MKKIKYLFYFLVVCFCVFRNWDYRLVLLPYKSLTFSELPKEVQASLCVSDYDSLCFVANSHTLMFVDSIDYNRYKHETVEFGPWIAYEKITDTQKDNVYRVEYYMSMPYILYKERLYIANDYNFLFYQFKEVKYTEYELK